MTTVKVIREYFRLYTNPGAGLPHRETIGEWETHYPAIREAYRNAAEGRTVDVQRVTVHEPYAFLGDIEVTETVTGEVRIGDDFRMDPRLSREGAGRQWITPETIDL